VPLVAAMANASALADQQRGDELVRRIGEDEVGRVKADGVPEAKLLHARLCGGRRGRVRVRENKVTTAKVVKGQLLWFDANGARARCVTTDLVLVTVTIPSQSSSCDDCWCLLALPVLSCRRSKTFRQ
jgi:hypothetical protein